MQLALWNDDVRPADEASGVHPRPPARGDARPRGCRDAPLLRSPPGGALPTSPSDLGRLEARAARYVDDAHAVNTRRAYQHDWNAFTAWCGARGLEALPASSHTLSLYLTHLAERGLRPSTIRRARIAIGLAHAHAGAERPDQNTRVRALERGIGRTHGTREEGAPPLLAADLARAVRALGHSPRDVRDRAVLLLGFAAALRCSELAGLNVADVLFTPEGVVVDVRRSKEDQRGKGARTTVPHGADAATCPVRALAAWMGRVGRPAGPLFRVVNGATIEHQRMSARCVSRAVQRAVTRAGVDQHYSAHSLRAGLATDAYAHGATVREIQLQGRWQDVRSVERYIRMDCVPGRRNVVEGLL